MQRGQDDPDAQLLVTLRSGDFSLDEWTKFVERIARFLCYHFPALQPESDDLAAQAALAVYEHLPSFRGDCRFIYWVFQIAHNKVKRYLRKTKNATIVSVGELIDEPRDPHDDIETALRLLVAEEALATLTEQERTVHLLRVLEDLDHKDIAKRLGITDVASRTTAYRAARKIGAYIRAHPL
jgi:RNA polymerase sigma-70 factor (ECF subfamily)